jgi:hypothetical protein
MNLELQAKAAAVGLMDPERAKLRLAFGLACVERVAHLLEDARVMDGLGVLRAFVDGRCSDNALEDARVRVESVARSHPASRSIDGAAHAAVSATNAVANALAGRALDAASYAAYATVYAYGGYAVSDPSAFESEFQWQVQELGRLSGAVPPA